MAPPSIGNSLVAAPTGGAAIGETEGAPADFVGTRPQLWPVTAVGPAGALSLEAASLGSGILLGFQPAGGVHSVRETDLTLYCLLVPPSMGQISGCGAGGRRTPESYHEETGEVVDELSTISGSARRRCGEPEESGPVVEEEDARV